MKKTPNSRQYSKHKSPEEKISNNPRCGRLLERQENCVQKMSESPSVIM